MKYQKGVANLIQGVSEQSDFLRDDSQVTEMINFIPDAAEGLNKRLGTRYKGTLPLGIPDNSKFHWIDRDQREKYLLVITPTEIRVFDRDGNEKLVNDKSNPYIQTANPVTDIAVMTVADNTYIVNKTKETRAEKLQDTYGKSDTGMIFVKQGGYSITYTVKARAVLEDWKTIATHETTNGYKIDPETGKLVDPAELDPEALKKITTDYIAEQLYKNWQKGAASSPYTLELVGNLIEIKRSDGRPFTISTSDGLGDSGMRGLKASTTSVTDLPAEGISSFRIQITGAVSSDSDDYYVAFSYEDKDEDGYFEKMITSGAWIECHGFDQHERPLASTMPHVLQSNADEQRSFSLLPITWKARNAGDSKSNPRPSFLTSDSDVEEGNPGVTINDVFFYSNRLCFLTDESVIFSRANDYYNFYRRSVRTLLSDDVIDVQPDTDRVTYFHSASTFQGNLYLISNNIQFKLTNTGALTTSNIQIRPMSYFHIPPNVSAVSSGKLMFIPEMRLGYSSIREYYLDTVNETEDSTDATSHVPSYIKGNIDQIAISIGKDTLLLRTDEDNKDYSTLYMHRFLWRGNEKLQAAWSKLSFNGEVLYFTNFDNKFILLIRRNGFLVMEEWSPSPTSGELQDELLHHVPARLDSSELVRVGNPIRQRTQDIPLIAFTMKGDIIDTLKEGYDQLIDPNSQKAIQDFIIGYPYTASVTLTKLRLKGNDNKPILDTRMQIHNLLTQVIDSGSLYCRTLSEGKDILTTNSPSYRLGSPNLETNQAHIRTEIIKMPIRSKGERAIITLYSPDSLPLKVDAVEWIGTARKRGSTQL